MAETDDQSQRTEEPTAKRLADARRKGDAPKSQEMVVALSLFAALMALWFLAGPAAGMMGQTLTGFVERPHAIIVDGPGLHRLGAMLVASLAAPFLMVVALFWVAAVAGNMVQARPVFTTKRMQPSLSKLSPIKGAGRVFGPQGLANFLKGFAKLLIMGTVIGGVFWASRQDFVAILGASASTILVTAATMLGRLLLAVCMAMAVIAGLDYAWQLRSWKHRLRMTREEVRREQKETDGDPQVKTRQRQIRDRQARQRTIAAVKEATVVIMNPTHFAVALAYEEGVNDAPVCTAKGQDDLALRMRQTARAHGVPVVENPPLARALHAAAALNVAIPVAHYEAVAKIIGFILSRRKPARQ
ncbi:MAG: flagellar type III secretion system protein FlhB [Pseudomonadota bacterium]